MPSGAAPIPVEGAATRSFTADEDACSLTRHDVAQRFPTPFLKEVLARTKDIGLEPAYVYGLIRQESRFITDARSVNSLWYRAGSDRFVVCDEATAEVLRTAGVEKNAIAALGSLAVAEGR